MYLVLRRGCWGWARNPGSWLFWTADTWPVTFDVGKMWLAVTTLHVGGGRAVGTTTDNLRQSLPAAGIIEESESARGERGRVGQGRVGFRV